MSLEQRLSRRCAFAALSTAVLVTGGLTAAVASAADLASETPQQVLQATVAAVKSAKSFEMHVHAHEATGGDEVVNLVAAGNGGTYMSAVQGQEKVKLIIKGKKAYLKASASFWAKEGSSKGLGKLLAPHWYKYPISATAQISSGVTAFSPSTLTKCLTEGNTQQLSNLGAQTVDGKAAVVLKDAGTAPATRPETFAVAATGPAYPLRIAITGPSTPGPISKCNDGQNDKETGTVTMNHWNSAPAVKAPAHAIKLPTKQAG